MDLVPATKKKARFAAGGIAAAGAFAILASGHSASAATTSSSTATSTKSTAIKPQTVSKYTVVKGDTLSGIASRAGVSLNALIKANGIPVAKPLQIGQHLILPTSTPKATNATVSSAGVMPTDLPIDSSRFALKPVFSAAAAKYGVSVSYLEAMTWNESGWQNSVVSSTGAVGIGQLMPSAIQYVNDYLVKTPLNPYTQTGNINISAAYLKYLVNQNNGDYRTALAAYYQGQASVKAVGIGSDTKSYVANVIALRSRYFS